MKIQGFRDKGVLADLVSCVSVVYYFFFYLQKLYWFSQNQHEVVGDCYHRYPYLQGLWGLMTWSRRKKSWCWSTVWIQKRAQNSCKIWSCVIFGLKDSCEKEKWPMSIFLSEHATGDTALIEGVACSSSFISNISILQVPSLWFKP